MTKEYVEDRIQAESDLRDSLRAEDLRHFVYFKQALEKAQGLEASTLQ